MICDHVSCQRKLRITQVEMKCKCGKMFCNFHRDHDCAYDHQTEFKKKISATLVKVETDKIIRI